MKSLSSKLTAMVLAITILGMGLIAGSSVYIMKSSMLDGSLGRVQQATENQASRINSWFERQSEHVEALAIELGYYDDYSAENLLPRLNSHVESNEEYYDVYMGFPNGIITLASGFQMNYAAGWNATNRPWYEGAMKNVEETFIAPPYVDSQSGELCITASKAVINTDGTVAGVAAIDIMLSELEELVEGVSVGPSGIAFLISTTGDILIDPHPGHAPSPDGTMRNVKNIEGGYFIDVWNALNSGELPYEEENISGIPCYFSAAQIDSTGWYLFTEVEKSIVEEPIVNQMMIALAIGLIILLVAIVFIFLVTRNVVTRPIKSVSEGADEISEGNVDIELKKHSDDEIGDLVDSFNKMASRVKGQAHATQDIADGNLTVDVPVRSDDDIMGQALIRLRDVLIEFVEAITDTAEGLNEGSSGIALSANSVAQGAKQQTEAVQDLTLATVSLATTIGETEKRTTETQRLMRDNIGENTRVGSQKMEDMMEANEEISEASTNISSIIKLIDDIAFQTNILALNATVEAARAGEHGKGFAIVADEVRILAGKSAEAASETANIIEDMIKKAESGINIAQEVNETFIEIFDGIEKTTELAGELNESAREQLIDITRVNQKIDQVYEIVKVNNTNSGHFAEASQDLSIEASRLSEIVSRFRTKDLGGDN